MSSAASLKKPVDPTHIARSAPTSDSVTSPDHHGAWTAQLTVRPVAPRGPTGPTTNDSRVAVLQQFFANQIRDSEGLYAASDAMGDLQETFHQDKSQIARFLMDHGLPSSLNQLITGEQVLRSKVDEYEHRRLHQHGQVEREEFHRTAEIDHASRLIDELWNKVRHADGNDLATIVAHTDHIYRIVQFVIQKSPYMQFEKWKEHYVLDNYKLSRAILSIHADVARHAMVEIQKNGPPVPLKSLKEAKKNTPEQHAAHVAAQKVRYQSGAAHPASDHLDQAEQSQIKEQQNDMLSGIIPVLRDFFKKGEGKKIAESDRDTTLFDQVTISPEKTSILQSFALLNSFAAPENVWEKSGIAVHSEMKERADRIDNDCDGDFIAATSKLEKQTVQLLNDIAGDVFQILKTQNAESINGADDVGDHLNDAFHTNARERFATLRKNITDKIVTFNDEQFNPETTYGKIASYAVYRDISGFTEQLLPEYRRTPHYAESAENEADDIRELHLVDAENILDDAQGHLLNINELAENYLAGESLLHLQAHLDDIKSTFASDGKTDVETLRSALKEAEAGIETFISATTQATLKTKGADEAQSLASIYNRLSSSVAIVKAEYESVLSNRYKRDDYASTVLDPKHDGSAMQNLFLLHGGYWDLHDVADHRSTGVMTKLAETNAEFLSLSVDIEKIDADVRQAKKSERARTARTNKSAKKRETNKIKADAAAVTEAERISVIDAQKTKQRLATGAARRHKEEAAEKAAAQAKAEQDAALAVSKPEREALKRKEIKERRLDRLQKGEAEFSTAIQPWTDFRATHQEDETVPASEKTAAAEASWSNVKELYDDLPEKIQKDADRIQSIATIWNNLSTGAWDALASGLHTGSKTGQPEQTDNLESRLWFDRMALDDKVQIVSSLRPDAIEAHNAIMQESERRWKIKENINKRRSENHKRGVDRSIRRIQESENLSLLEVAAKYPTVKTHIFNQLKPEIELALDSGESVAMVSQKFPVFSEEIQWMRIPLDETTDDESDSESVTSRSSHT